MDLYIAKREVLENFPKNKIILLKEKSAVTALRGSCKYSTDSSSDNISEAFQGGGDCMLSLPR